MNDTAPSRFPWPPLLYLAAIALGFVLGALVPSPWIGPPFSDILFAVGIVMIAAVAAIGIAAVRALRRGATTIMAHRPSEHLVTGGPFSFTRDPLYLAGTMLTLAIGLIAGNPWHLPLALLAAFATQKLAIEPEERHLAERFGKRYRDYAKRVRRWI